MNLKYNQGGRKVYNRWFWGFKSLSLILFLLFIGYKLVTKYEMDISIFNISFLNIKLSIWLLGYLVAILIAYIIHLIVFIVVLKSNFKMNFPYKKLFKLISDKEKPIIFIVKTLIFPFYDTETELKNDTKLIRRTKAWVYKLISPDYSYANTFKVILWNNKLNYRCPQKDGNKHNKVINGKKEKCPQLTEDIYECEFQHKRNRRKDFVIYSNWANIMFVCLLAVIAVTWTNPVIYTFLIFHTVSRILEIITAFYKDVVRAKMYAKNLNIGYKSSSLKRGNRISLALHSYLEVVILYATIYYLSISFITLKIGENADYLDFILYSMAVSAFNYSLDINNTTLSKLLHVSQVFTSTTLVVLSIATYIGLRDDMTDRDKVEWDKNEFV
ncbi:hypothetical protein [Bacillus tropicus]|uniref:hypothetical protein n=1 Tax=Bacillus tropicus TaxID=2026188 RepID=UPI003977DB3E